MPDAAYMREWRQTPSGQTAMENQRRRDRARATAVRRLIEKYPTQWQAIFNEELRMQGLAD